MRLPEIRRQACFRFPVTPKNFLLEGNAAIFEADPQLRVLTGQLGLQLQFQRLHPFKQV